MAKKKTVIRTAKNADEKYLGTEPVLSDAPGRVELMRARTWYNYFYDADGARKFLVEYLRHSKADASTITAVRSSSKADIYSVGITIGWNARMMFRGGNLPASVITKTKEKIIQLVERSQSQTIVVEQKTVAPVVTIQQRMQHKAAELISSIEDHYYDFTDELFKSKSTPKFDFNAYEFLQSADTSGPVVALIIDRWKDEAEEIDLAINRKCDQCVEAYSRYTKRQLTTMSKTLHAIVGDLERFVLNTKKVRKPRKVKDAPAAKQVAKIQYKKDDKELKLSSINPLHLIGASELWTYNTKYRTLTVYHALSRTGLGMKGTTIQGFDQESSMSRKLRKPELTLGQVLKGTKTKCKKLMNELTTKLSSPNGRVNTETILLKVIK